MHLPDDHLIRFPHGEVWRGPLYNFKDYKLFQGRRVSKEIAVINPTIYEIKDILHNMGFKIYAEDKVIVTKIIFV